MFGPFQPKFGPERTGGHYVTPPGSARYGGGRTYWQEDPQKNFGPFRPAHMDFTPGPARPPEQPMESKRFGPDRPAEAPPAGHFETTPGSARYGGGHQHWVEDAKQGAEQVKGALQSVSGVTVAPHVDTSSLDAATAKVLALKAALAGLGGAMSAATAGLKIPNPGSIQRGSFKDGGIAGGAG